MPDAISPAEMKLKARIKELENAIIALYGDADIKPHITIANEVMLLEALGHPRNTIGQVLTGECWLTIGNNIICGKPKEKSS